jgi:hydroxymethylpyrimidine/phosphomethylpyrimidine kinase
MLPRTPMHPSALPCALSVGGLDPGGGAGIVADLRAFGAAGAFGCAAITLLTVQSTAGLRSTRKIPPAEVLAQVREVIRHQDVRAVKIGACGSEDNVRALGTWLGSHPHVPVVLDPVLRPTRGTRRLLPHAALNALRAELVARASVVTANAEEASVLVSRPVTTLAEARQAAAALCRLGARAAVVKGGHLKGEDATDVLAIGSQTIDLRAPRLRLSRLHGGGCILASLVAGRLAVDARRFSVDADTAIVAAVRWAKRRHHAALLRAVDVGGPARVLVP